MQHQYFRLALVASFMSAGCGIIGALVNGGEKDKGIDAQLRDAEAAPAVVDKDSFLKRDGLFHIVVKSGEGYLERDCGPGGKGKRCDEVRKQRNEYVDKRVTLWREAMKMPAIGHEALQGSVALATSDPAYASHFQEMEAMILELAARKVAYWQGELKARGGLEGWVRAEGKSLCVLLASPGASSEQLKYVFRNGDQVVVRCQFPVAPRTFRRDVTDRWGVSLAHMRDFEPIPMYYDVEEPSAQKTVEFSFPADMIAKRVTEESRSSWFKNGTWQLGRVDYFTRYIAGKKLRDGRLEDIWQNDSQAGGTFFYMLQ